METTIELDLGFLGYVEVEVEFNYTPAKPGKFSGPPEDCYPDEPAEVEILKVTFPGGSLEALIRENMDDDESIWEELSDYAEAELEDERNGE